MHSNHAAAKSTAKATATNNQNNHRTNAKLLTCVNCSPGLQKYGPYQWLWDGGSHQIVWTHRNVTNSILSLRYAHSNSLMHTQTTTTTKNQKQHNGDDRVLCCTCRVLCVLVLCVFVSVDGCSCTVICVPVLLMCVLSVRVLFVWSVRPGDNRLCEWRMSFFCVLCCLCCGLFALCLLRACL